MVVCREHSSKEGKEYIYKWIKEIIQGNQKTPLTIKFKGLDINYSRHTSAFAFSWQEEDNKKTDK